MRTGKKENRKGKNRGKGKGKNIELREPTEREWDHEAYRIQTMGDKVVRRLKTIRKPQKMFAFYKVAWALGERKLAMKAKAKLQEMGVAV